MSDCTIIIKGPGKVINYEAEVILKALRDAGCTVTIHNPEADENPEVCQAEIYKRLTDDNWAGDDYPELKGRITKKVQIFVDHQPWGG